MTLVIDDLFSVKGKVVLVTGGSRGIGLAIAEGFVRGGARVYVSSRKSEACQLAAEELSQHGECHPLPADVTTTEGRDALRRAVAQRERGLDVLINNAGALWAETLEDYPESGWDKVFNLNVKGVFFLIQAFAALLKAAATPDDPSRIINIGSIDALHVPTHETYAYTSSKAAVHQLTRHLARQLAPDSVTVNVIAPGLFRSKMLEGTIEKLGEDTMLKPVPLKRFVSRSDIAAASIYLASPAGSYLTGVTLPVDGGTSTTL